MDYKFNVGDRVVNTSLTMSGEVTDMVPGNGSIEWYYVIWDDGSSDRYTRDELANG